MTKGKGQQVLPHQVRQSSHVSHQVFSVDDQVLMHLERRLPL